MDRPLAEHGLWLGVYGDRGPPIAAPIVLGIFDEAAVAFDLQLNRVKGAFDTDDHHRIESPREWLAKSIERQWEAAKAKDLGALFQIYVVRSKVLHWSIVSLADTQYEDDGRIEPDPRLFLKADLGLANSADSVKAFVKNVTQLLLRDRSIWYAFINPAPRRHVPHPALYDNNLYNNVSWEQLVEKDTWLYHQRGTRDRVRGLYWGNIFGPDFTKRLMDAGFEERFAWLKESWPWNPTILRDTDTGSLAVLLDDDPVGFAQKRDSELDSDCSAVRGGGLLRSVLSRAGLL